MPLSVLAGILNTGKTFPLALCFITSESAASFDFMEDTLDELFFYNCPRPKVVCGDFAKDWQYQLRLVRQQDKKLG